MAQQHHHFHHHHLCQPQFSSRLSILSCYPIYVCAGSCLPLPPPRGGRVEGMRVQLLGFSRSQVPRSNFLDFPAHFPGKRAVFSQVSADLGRMSVKKKNVPHKQFPSTINQQSLRAPPQRVRLCRGRSDTSRTPPPVSPAAVAKSSATPSGRPSLLGCGWSSSARTNWPRPPVQPRTAG